MWLPAAGGAKRRKLLAKGGHKLSDTQLKRGGETNKWREGRKEVKQRKYSLTNSFESLYKNEKKEPMKTAQNQISVFNEK